MCTVSVIIPTFNRAQLLPVAIASALSQTRPVHEIVVIDDGSTDDTREVIRRFGDRVHYVFQANAGPSSARNRGIKSASGDFVAFLDSDDVWVPQKNEWQLSFFEQNSNIDFLFGNMANFSGNVFSHVAEVKNRELHDYLVAHATHLSDFLKWLIIENVIPTPTVMARRAACLSVGEFNERLRIAEDLDYWIRSSSRFRWGFINGVLLHRRIHQTNLVSDAIPRNRALLNVLETTAAAAVAGSEQLEQILVQKIRSIRYDLGSHYFYARNYSEAIKYLAQVSGGRVGWNAKIKLLVANLLNPVSAIARQASGMSG